MIPHGPLPDVSIDEKLARFVTVEWWVRPDETLRPEAFDPPKDLNYSVTRHLSLAEEELWDIGQKVVEELAVKRKAALHGRADFVTTDAQKLNLVVQAAPLNRNPHHVHVSGWPEKPLRKQISQKLAAAAKFIPKPV
jgi:hypothetical protein